MTFLSEFKAEMRRAAFLEFIHRKDDLELICVTLALLKKKGMTRSELISEFYPLSERPTTAAFRILSFLTDQRLIVVLKKKRAGCLVYKAIPTAIDELVYCITHDGCKSPYPPSSSSSSSSSKLELAEIISEYSRKISDALNEVHARSAEKLVLLAEVREGRSKQSAETGKS